MMKGGVLERIIAWIRWLAIKVLSQGEIPRHVAFIMDGNRRFAKKMKKETLVGHKAGFYALEHILDWSMQLGIKEVSVYAFSIENFKRPKDEVDGLMDLAAKKFNEMMQENKMIDKLGIRVRVVGDISLIPLTTRKAIDEVVEYSKNNTKATLNVCFAYTARDEMTRAVRSIADTAIRARELTRSGQLGRAQEGDEGRVLRLIQGGADAVVAPPSGVDGLWGEEASEGREGQWGWEDEVWHAMELDNAPELLVRTSGEIRLSDFMLWQTAFSVVVFLNVLWPDFSLWHFLYVILVYQSKFSLMKDRRKYYANNIKNCASKEPKEWYEKHVRVQT